jgi:hypothetical protein
MIRTSSGTSPKSAFAWRNDSNWLTIEPCCSAWRRSGLNSPTRPAKYANSSARMARTRSEICLNERTCTAGRGTVVPRTLSRLQMRSLSRQPYALASVNRLGFPFALQRVAMRRRDKEAATYRRDLRPTVPVPGTWQRQSCIRWASFAPPLTHKCAQQKPVAGRIGQRNKWPIQQRSATKRGLALKKTSRGVR